MENRILRKSTYKKGRNRFNSETTKSQSEEVNIAQNNPIQLCEEVKNVTSALQKCIEEVMANDVVIRRLQSFIGSFYTCYSN